MMKPTENSCITALLVAACTGYANAATIPSSVINSGGGQSTSANYSTHPGIGQFSGVMYSGTGHRLLASVHGIIDLDGDGYVDIVDNCRSDSNDQADNDMDMMGDACDPDDDNDGLTDVAEANAGTDPYSADTDGDGFADGSDPDPLTPHLKGDVAPYGGTDGVLNGGDLVVMLRMVLGGLTPTGDDVIRGDLHPSGNPDGVINSQDLILLEQLVVQ